MNENDRTRGISFTSLVMMLLVFSGFIIARSARDLAGPATPTGATAAGATDALAPVSLGLATCFIVCAVGVLLWKRWAIYGLIALGSIGTILYVAQGAYNVLVMPLLALMVVLISVLTKEWFGMG